MVIPLSSVWSLADVGATAGWRPFVSAKHSHRFWECRRRDPRRRESRVQPASVRVMLSRMKHPSIVSANPKSMATAPTRNGGMKRRNSLMGGSVTV